VNVIEMHHKVFPILGEALASSPSKKKRKMKWMTILAANPNNVTYQHTGNRTATSG